MHISDGYLPAQAWAGGYALTGLLTWHSLRQIEKEPDPTANIPKAALLAAVFFLASSFKLPLPPTSVNPLLNGLLGIMLGYYAFPAILVGLFFQAAMFQHGGLTTLGLNALTAGIPALLVYHLFQLKYVLRLKNQIWDGLFGFAAGFLGVALTTIFIFGLLLGAVAVGDRSALDINGLLSSLVIAHIPLMLAEGVFTALVAIFLGKVKPDLLMRLPKRRFTTEEQSLK
ncbi:cobalamin (vitamin B12) biosynthesis CbiM protein [Thalassoporum mexicanum PCC 7367]|uniref:cobalt transporter CbiM n=1 Tax=Thalassoporum mexicanum TaxID=3457544 RepID=UPI00029FAEA7|nr:cobalt transporter CbiM [Pseudanabaena sp. PCC 7367]AFY71812.1 cobalamin (vitamin B12) biosynthesis CbiM protein [Pseudanabaena sp. PCC 7367]